MAFFKQESDEDWRQKRSQEQLALGGLPLNAEHRLRRLTENRRLFTSAFSVNEFALLASERVIPLGQVTGSSAFHVGWQPVPVYESTELMTLTQAQNQVRRLALVRMQKEAERLGAHVVIGVRLTGHVQDWGKNLLAFTAIGTAVRWPESGPPGFPLACALSAQELWSLRQAGHLPVGIALGTCVYYQIASPMTTQVVQGGLFNGASRVNQEIKVYSQGFYEARLQAMTTMEEDAASYYADGIIGVEIAHTLEVRDVEIEVNESKQQRRDCIATFTALGTAIRSFQGAPSLIRGVLPLNQ